MLMCEPPAYGGNAICSQFIIFLFLLHTRAVHVYNVCECAVRFFRAFTVFIRNAGGRLKLRPIYYAYSPTISLYRMYIQHLVLLYRCTESTYMYILYSDIVGIYDVLYLLYSDIIVLYVATNSPTISLCRMYIQYSVLIYQIIICSNNVFTHTCIR